MRSGAPQGSHGRCLGGLLGLHRALHHRVVRLEGGDERIVVLEWRARGADWLNTLAEAILAHQPAGDGNRRRHPVARWRGRAGPEACARAGAEAGALRCEAACRVQLAPSHSAFQNAARGGRRAGSRARAHVMIFLQCSSFVLIQRVAWLKVCALMAPPKSSLT